MCFHPNGNLLAVATQNNKWLILDSNTGEEFYSCEVGAEQHDCIKYSPGTWIICHLKRTNSRVKILNGVVRHTFLKMEKFTACEGLMKKPIAFIEFALP